MLQSRTAGYESSQYPGSLAGSAASKRDSKLSPDVRDDDFESSKSSLAAFRSSASIREKHRANLTFSVEKVTFRRERVRVFEAYQYAEKRGVHD